MKIRTAIEKDIPEILNIYNQGIEDRIATLETNIKDMDYMSEWLNKRQERYLILVATINNRLVGWASINPYNNRCSYSGVGDLSIYIYRDYRGKGIGQQLLDALEAKGKENGFRKFVLFTFPFNELGQGLYRKAGYREVGVFKVQGILDGRPVDVMAMEKIIR